MNYYQDRKLSPADFCRQEVPLKMIALRSSLQVNDGVADSITQGRIVAESGLTKDDLISEKGWNLSMGARPINLLLIEAPDAEKIDVALIEICAFGHTRWDRHSRRKVW